MIVLDANILLYAYDATSTDHQKARAWVEQIFSEPTPVYLPWSTIEAFLRVITNAKLPGRRYSIAEAVSVVDSWLEQPQIRTLAPVEDHWTTFKQVVQLGQASGVLVKDAALAAVTIEHGGILHTTDRDFTRFPGLRWSNPLA